MVNFCAVFGCSNRSTREKIKAFIGYQRFFNVEKGVDIKDQSERYRPICFTSSSMLRSFCIRNSPDWIPTLCLGHMKFKPATDISIERYNRIQSRLKRKRDCISEEEEKENVAKVENSLSNSEFNPDEEQVNHVECQTDMSGADIETWQDGCQSLQHEIHKLTKAKSNPTFGTEAFFDSDEKVLLYTGLTNQKLLKILFTFCAPVVTISANAALTPFQEMTLTLCRLRLNLNVKDLAYRFDVSPGTVSKAWGGRASDKYITENCQLLNNLLPGDFILADRGFDISDSVGFYNAQIVTICAALCNLCPSVIPFE
eukprot:gene2737-3162_t